MTPYYADASITVHAGDCLDVLRALPDASVDAVCTDPPYGLANTTPEQVADTLVRWVNGDRDYIPAGRGFMGKPWDAFVPPVAVWDECMRVLKPGGHVLAFAGSRTHDLMTLGIRLAGFDIRDTIAWLSGSGFPKSLDVSKAIDKSDAGQERRRRNLSFTEWLRSTGVTSRQIDVATSSFMGGHYLTAREQAAVPTADMFDLIRPLLSVNVPAWVEALVAERTVESENYKARPITQAEVRPLASGEHITFDQRSSKERERRDIPATPDAERWQGWGTALKPAHEPIVVARKPLSGTVAANVLAHGTGALNVDGCRVEGEANRPTGLKKDGSRSQKVGHEGWDRPWKNDERADRVIGDGERTTATGRWPANVILDESQAEALDEQSGESVTPSKVTRGASLAGKEGATARSGGGMERRENVPCHGDSGGASRFFYVAKADASERVRVNGVAHPTVKPLALMRWLVRLVTPPGGTVLEPFAGSGTTVEACILEGFRCVAIERDETYLPLIRQRIHRRRDPVEAVRGTGEDGGLFDLLNDGEPA